jgi:hypothetical protein
MLSRGLTCAALLPFFAAIAARFGSTPAAPIQNQPELPPLAFSQYAVNLGDVTPRPVVPAHFDFVNTGDTSVTITKLEPSCGCLNPQLVGDKKVYAPGERGRFYVSVRTANESSGPHAYTVGVHYADPRPHQDTLTFRLTLPERKVSVEPPEIFFYQLTGEPDSRVVYVTDYRGHGLEVQEATCSLEFVTVEVLPREQDENGHERTPIRVSVAGDVPPGRVIRAVRIRTNDPDFEQLHAAVVIHGPQDIQRAAFERPEGTSIRNRTVPLPPGVEAVQ